MIDMDVLVILDRSGSMEGMKRDHEGGLRSFVEDQQSEPGDVRFTFVRFDSEDACEIVYDRVPIGQVDSTKLTLIPRGGTPLLDAVGRATTHLIEKQKAEPSNDTIVFIVTDGEENQSREWTREKVKARIAEIEKHGKVLYLGANVDAFHEASGIGVAAGSAMGYTQPGTHAMYAAASSNLKSARNVLRTARESGVEVSEASYANLMNFSEEQRIGAAGGETDGSVPGDGGSESNEESER